MEGNSPTGVGGSGDHQFGNSFPGPGVSRFNNYGVLTKTAKAGRSSTATSPAIPAATTSPSPTPARSTSTPARLSSPPRTHHHQHLDRRGGWRYRLRLNAGFTFTGSAGISGPGIIELNGGTYTFPAGSFTPTGSVSFNGGTVTVNNVLTPTSLSAISGTVTFNEPLVYAGPIEVAGTVAFNRDQTFQTLTAQGNLAGHGDVTVTGTLTMRNAMSGTGRFTVAAGATAVCEGMSLGRRFDNYGTLTLVDGTGMLGSSSKTFEFNNHGTVVMEGNSPTGVGGSGDHQFGNSFPGPGVSRFNNYGVLTKNGASRTIFNGNIPAIPAATTSPSPTPARSTSTPARSSSPPRDTPSKE